MFCFKKEKINILSVISFLFDCFMNVIVLIIVIFSEVKMFVWIVDVCLVKFNVFGEDLSFWFVFFVFLVSVKLVKVKY